MGVRFWSGVEKACSLYTLLCDVLKIADHILCFPSQLSVRRSRYARTNDLLFIRPRHIPRSVNHLLPSREELIQILHALRVFVQEFRLARLWFSSLDEVEDSHGRSVAGEEVIEMARCSGEEGIDDANCKMMRDSGDKGERAERTLDRRLGAHVVQLLRPEDRDTATILICYQQPRLCT